MLSGKRVIHYSVELAYPAMPQMRIKKGEVRQLYHKLHEPGGYGYENLDIQADKPTLLTKKDKGQSLCQIGPDSIRVQEDYLDGGVDDFVMIVETVLKGFAPGVLPPLYLQKCKIQCLVQPQSGDSRLLLAGKIATVLDKIDPFERPPSFFGVRFRFEPGVEEIEPAAPGTTPAAEETEEKRPAKRKKTGPRPKEYKGYLTLRFETFAEDIKQVWMQVEALYPETFGVEDFKRIGDNIRETHKFLVDKATRFLEQFDEKADAEEGD